MGGLGGGGRKAVRGRRSTGYGAADGGPFPQQHECGVLSVGWGMEDGRLWDWRGSSPPGACGGLGRHPTRMGHETCFSGRRRGRQCEGGESGWLDGLVGQAGWGVDRVRSRRRARCEALVGTGQCGVAGHGGGGRGGAGGGRWLCVGGWSCGASVLGKSLLGASLLGKSGRIERVDGECVWCG